MDVGLPIPTVVPAAPCMHAWQWHHHQLLCTSLCMGASHAMHTHGPGMACMRIQWHACVCMAAMHAHIRTSVISMSISIVRMSASHILHPTSSMSSSIEVRMCASYLLPPTSYQHEQQHRGEQQSGPFYEGQVSARPQ